MLYNRCLLRHTKIRILYGCIVYIYIDKHIFNYKIVNKIGPHFVYFVREGGGGGLKENGGKKM